MKLKIEKAFTDKFTGEKYNVGDVKDFASDRGTELLADNRILVSLVEQPKQEVKQEVKQEPKVKRTKK